MRQTAKRENDITFRSPRGRRALNPGTMQKTKVFAFLAGNRPKSSPVSGSDRKCCRERDLFRALCRNARGHIAAANAECRPGSSQRIRRLSREGSRARFVMLAKASIHVQACAAARKRVVSRLTPRADETRGRDRRPLPGHARKGDLLAAPLDRRRDLRLSRYLATVRRAMSMLASRNRPTIASSDSTPSGASPSISCLMRWRTASAECASLPYCAEIAAEKKNFISKSPRGVDMYLFEVTRDTVDSCMPIASAMARRLSGRRCCTPWTKKPSCWRTISDPTFRIVRARCSRLFVSQFAFCRQLAMKLLSVVAAAARPRSQTSG